MRTPEQVAPDEDLRAAIEKHFRFWNEGETGMLLDFVVVGSTVEYDHDGDPNYSVWTQHTEDAMPRHRILGLLDLAAHHTRVGVE